MPDLTAVQQRIDENLQREKAALLELSHRIHANPEIRFEEVKASGWLTHELESRGFTVERGVAGLPTAFRAVKRGKPGGPTIAVLCEYDALPGIGHACGHNVIATMGAGAGYALAPLMDEISGTLVVMGTPAEEGGGGKVIMLREGAFDGVDAAMMIHPFHVNQANMPTLASTKWDVTYHGIPAHAAMAPHLGVNALDAIRLALAGVDAMRQQLRQDVRLHTIITHGGDAANIIPERASMLSVARAADAGYLFDVLVPRMRAIFEGAALMTGARLEITDSSGAYLEMAVNRPLEDAFERHVTRRGRPFVTYDPNERTGSTDMGNVSQALPGLHGMLAIDDTALPHTDAFREAALSARGDATVIDGASIMAGITAELFLDADLLATARAAFAAQRAAAASRL
ncbi:MAG TPA: M20 family metallopeptidase [Trueperaceae bacterium]|nr:M20 family metallopeptidase [Trueperaceae bacterium]